jgi:hypothetical protein
MKTPEELKAFRRETRSTFCANKSRGECDAVYRRIGALVQQRDAGRDAASDRRARSTALRALDSCPSGEGRRARDCGEQVRRPEVPVLPRGYRARFVQRKDAPVARNRRFDSPRGDELRSLEALRADHGSLDCLREEVARDERLLRRSKPSDGRGEALWVEEPLPRALRKAKEKEQSRPAVPHKTRRPSPSAREVEPEPEPEPEPKETQRPGAEIKPESKATRTARRSSPSATRQRLGPSAAIESTSAAEKPTRPLPSAAIESTSAAEKPTRPLPSAEIESTSVSIESTPSGSALPTWTEQPESVAAPSAKEAQSYPSSNRPLPKREQSRPAAVVRSGSPKGVRPSASASSPSSARSASSASSASAAPESVIGSVPLVPKVPQLRWGALAPKPVPRAELSASAEDLLRRITRSEASTPSATPTEAEAIAPNVAQIQEGWRALAKRSLDRLGKTATDQQIDALAHQLGPYYDLAPSAVPAAIASHPAAADQLSRASDEIGALNAQNLAAHLVEVAAELMADFAL